jgi:hypothetical protein
LVGTYDVDFYTSVWASAILCTLHAHFPRIPKYALGAHLFYSHHLPDPRNPFDQGNLYVPFALFPPL